MKLHEFIDKSICVADFKAQNKEEGIHFLAQQAAQSKLVAGTTAEQIFTFLQKRESEGTTAFGNEVAIPHARIPSLTQPLFFIAISKKGIDFDAIDRKKVKLFFVILAPENAVDVHLQILAAVSRLLEGSNFQREILGVHTQEAMYENLLRHTASEPRHAQSQSMRLLVIVLYLQEFLEPILELLLEENIEGATILDSEGMGRYISRMPLFASFTSFLHEDKNMSKTILTVITEDQEAQIMDGIERITGSFDKHDGAMLFSLEIARVRGTMNMI